MNRVVPKEARGLRGIIYKNIDSLRRIRRTHTALLESTAANSANTNPGAEDEDAPRRHRYVRQADALPVVQSDPKTRLNSKENPSGGISIEGGSKTSSAVLKRNCAHLLEHSGFEGALFYLVSDSFDSHTLKLKISLLTLSVPALRFIIIGSSSRALDMLTHVAGEFIMNMGRTLRFLSDQKPLNMTPEVCFFLHCGNT